MSRKAPVRKKKKAARATVPPVPDKSAAVEEGAPKACPDPAAKGFRFDDPYWDDAFDSWHNPTLRTCCRWC